MIISSLHRVNDITGMNLKNINELKLIPILKFHLDIMIKEI